ncbi:DoxX family protein [Flavobacterium chilense]|uniref:Putative oxidoreductase n=1 Tax=Flavobacterium chilense TaxID=946677 RepID=A0A1M7LBB8_9FLAO|nr:MULTISPECIES: DoxX family protein [Flavobacterium]SHM75318.1 putative oxidoreductase [Flavobacterium chilense]
MRKNNDFGLLILRITIGLLMLLHGISKFGGGLEFISGMLVEKGLPGFFAYGVLIGEILAPVLLIIGFRTRIAAIIYAVNCLVAVLMVHSADIFKLSDHGGWELELLGLYFFGSLVLFFTGGGKYALSKNNNWD